MHEVFRELGGNVCLWSGIGAWVLAQTTKVICNLAQTGRFDFHYMVGPGGMPSAHSAMVCALSTSVGLTVGVETPLFAATIALAAIVMFDAQTVRRAAGLQARLLNQIVDEIVKERRFPPQRQLAELLGHTRLEVFMGMIMGILMGLLAVSMAKR